MQIEFAPLRPSLAVLVRQDGAWLRCRDCDNAFWGVANATAVVLAKAQRHAVKAHAVGQAAGRPQRRNAAAQAVPADVTVALTALLVSIRGKKLGAGVAREGFVLTETTVIKFAKHSSRREDNLVEARAWASAPDWARPFLCPVVQVADDGEWIIMRRADRVGSLSQREREPVNAALGHFIEDLHVGNIGLVDGRPVATDYSGGWAAREVVWPSVAPAHLRAAQAAPQPQAQARKQVCHSDVTDCTMCGSLHTKLPSTHQSQCLSGFAIWQHRNGIVDDCGCPSCRRRIEGGVHA